MSGQEHKATTRDADSQIPRDLDASHPLIVFDGVCVLCSGFARLVVRLDREKRFRFATAQSPLGQALYRRHGLRTDFYETNLVIIDGVAFTRMDSLLAVCDALGWPWRAARLIRLLPHRARDRLYGWIANNRYAWFGRKDSCEIPSGELRERIIG
jgi:predicted DCC family thiol-disulfide oxidoreductase YuxK